MKKIVGILVVATMIASTVFAADVSAATKIKGQVFSYDNAKNFGLFAQSNDSHDYANPNISFSISDDKAGATIKLTTDGKEDTEVIRQTTQTFWFKPIDALKITLGNFDQALNKEQIKWTESAANLGGNGLVLSVNVEGFGLDFGLENCDGDPVSYKQGTAAYWFLKKDGVDDASIGTFFIKASYAADFGSIGGFVDFNHSKRPNIYAGHDYLFNGYGAAGYTPKAGSINDIFFGAGYNNSFNGINVFVNVLGYMADKFEWVRPEVYVAGSADAFSYKLFAAPTIFLDSDWRALHKDADGNDRASADLQILAYVQYALDGATVYFRFDDVNVLAKKFESELRFGAQGSVGAMGYNTWLQINTGKGAAKDKVDIALPFELTMSF